MEYLRIEIEKSRKEEKLILYRNSILENFIEIIFWVIIIGVFPFISTMNLINKLDYQESIFLPIFYLIISLIFSFLFFYSLLSLNKLKRINGISGSKNRSIIKEIGKELNWETQRHNQQITVLKKKWNWSSTNWGRQIVVIYDQKDILIDCITFGRYGMKSPFHWYSSRKLENIIKNKFEEKIKTTHNTV